MSDTLIHDEDKTVKCLSFKPCTFVTFFSVMTNINFDTMHETLLLHNLIFSKLAASTKSLSSRLCNW